MIPYSKKFAQTSRLGPKRVVDASEEWPHVTIWHLPRFRRIVQRRTNVDIRKTRQLQQRPEAITVGRRDVDHGQVIDDNIYSRKSLRHIPDLCHLMRREEDVKHRIEFFRFFPERVTYRVVQPDDFPVINRTQA